MDRAAVISIAGVERERERQILRNVLLLLLGLASTTGTFVDTTVGFSKI